MCWHACMQAHTFLQRRVYSIFKLSHDISTDSICHTEGRIYLFMDFYLGPASFHKGIGVAAYVNVSWAGNNSKLSQLCFENFNCGITNYNVQQ